MNMEQLLKSAEKFARTQKRVTNKSLRERLDITEDEADEVYSWLKLEGIIGSMGYVAAARPGAQ
jgi:predicted HTH transcriptional regulator